MKKVIWRTAVAVYSIFEFICAFIVLYACVFMVGGLFSTGMLLKTGDYILFIKSNGVHTDFCLPVKSDLIDWTTFIPLEDFPAVSSPQYISIGWGDKGFFLDTPQWSDLTFKTAFNAAFLKSGTAMHVAYLKNKPVESDRLALVHIDKQQYQTLIDYIQTSFFTISTKIVLIPNRGYWSNDNFYEANGNYHLFNTCNVWTNVGLKKMGVKTALFALSADGIMRHLQ